MVESRAGQFAGWSAQLQRLALPLLLLLVALLYLPSLGGGYLPYDDDWLIADNPVLEAPAGKALWAIFFDFSRETRLTLGAEYLPLRDFSHWCEIAVFGKSAFGMRLVQLAIYWGAVRLFWTAIERRVAPAATRVAMVCFAVHPTHVESVAWLAGRKDVLALLFLGAALSCYVRHDKARWCAVPFVMAAGLAKSMSVIGFGLMLALDAVGKRRPAWGVIAASGVAAAFVFWMQLRVGAAVGMVGGPLAESRVEAFWTMGEVWLLYVRALGLPWSLSIVYDVAPTAHATLLSVLGWALLFGSWGYALLRAVKGETFALGVVLWAWLPLAPVSQVVFPLQNVMADRYLWLTTLAVGLSLGAAWQARVTGAHRLLLRGAIVGVLAVFAVGTTTRAALFGDPVALFMDATDKSTGPRAPYQLGYVLAEGGDSARAIAAYETALLRPCSDCGPQRRAANNLARLFVERGELHSAERVLRQSAQRFPDDPKTAFNLVKVLTRVGKHDEARRLFDETRTRFPTYLPTAADAHERTLADEP